MRKNERNSSAKYTSNTRQPYRIYNGSFEEYEDPADYLALPDVLKGRVIA